MGNICRSPTAHGVMRHKVQALGLQQWLAVDSAGTHDYHTGNPPDARAQHHAAQRGYQLADLRARQVCAQDFAAHDLILAMDSDNLAQLQDRCPAQYQHKLQRLTHYCQKYSGLNVPDPYYGGAGGFEHVLDLVEDACDGLIAHLRQQAP